MTVGLLTLLIAANGEKKKNVCSGYRIRIISAPVNSTRECCVFVDEKDIVKLVTSATGGQIKDEPLSRFNLRRLEALMKNNKWIRDAELWFDNRAILHIKVTEREPVARVFTTSGKSFYIDKSGLRMPLSEKLSIRVPVFTGFPDKKLLTVKDSLLLGDIRNTAKFIISNPFWMSQVAQVDIVQSCGQYCWQFEMVPVIGNHIVKLGNGQDIDQKFNRLFIFYSQVLSKTGFDRYSTIDVQYERQVTGTQREKNKISVDTAVLKMNIEKLLKEESEMKKEVTENVNEPGSGNLPKADSAAATRKPKAVMKPRA